MTFEDVSELRALIYNIYNHIVFTCIIFVITLFIYDNNVSAYCLY